MLAQWYAQIAALLGNQILSHPWSELTARLWRLPMIDKLRFAGYFFDWLLDEAVDQLVD